MERMFAGIRHFGAVVFREHEELFRTLAGGQHPAVMMVACADSRVDPNLFTQSKPGEIFCCRNAGNIVPPHDHAGGAEAAALEFAVAVAQVRHLVICGHSDCGAMKALLDGKSARLPQVHAWIRRSEPALRQVPGEGAAGWDRERRLRALTERNVVLQMENARSHPAVARAAAEGRLRVHGWVYDIGSGTVSAYEEWSGEFRPIGIERERVREARG
jgi:carbonic anhydrase